MTNRNGKDIKMITQETAGRIWSTYREIEAGKKLLVDLHNTQEKAEDGFLSSEEKKTASNLMDAFGHRRDFQFGIPSGASAHRLFSVSPTLAVSVIKAHIANKRKELVELQEVARLELVEEALPEPSEDALERR